MSPQRSCTVDAFSLLKGTSRPIENLRRQIDSLAPSLDTVLVLGEPGTGKELVARALHERSPRKEHPFVAMHCAGPHVSFLTTQIFQSELFGHEHGAFHSFTEKLEGRATSTGRGTLLLDMLEPLADETQEKLCQLLGERTYRPLGGETTLRFEGRIVVATSAHLESPMDGQLLRSDLLALMSTHVIEVPPLRDRLDDLEPLCTHLLQPEERPARLEPDAYAWLRRRAWVGNVRELQTLLIRTMTKFSTSNQASEPLLITAAMLETIHSDRYRLRTPLEPADAS